MCRMPYESYRLYRVLAYIGRFSFLGVLLLSIITYISIPTILDMSIARTHLDGAVIQTSKGVSEIQVSLSSTFY